MENYEEALRIYKEVEEAELKTLGPTHRYYLTTKHNLAHCFQSMENYKKAVRICQQILGIQSLDRDIYQSTKSILGNCKKVSKCTIC